MIALAVVSCASHENNARPVRVAGLAPFSSDPRFETFEGGITRGPKAAKQIAFVFTGHGFAEGGEAILAALSRHNARASFFFTGDFVRNPEFAALTREIVRSGHYVGPHSDKHLLYCSWERERKLLVTREQFRADLEANLRAIEEFTPSRSQARFFLPPYEHYNAEIAAWTGEMGLGLISYTPGTRSNADYTGEADRNYVSSAAIFESILAKERRDPAGLNGFILLLHIGAGPGRTDKFHSKFGSLLDVLSEKGYRFVRVDELLKLKPH
jgi:peptidoglycan/xylan/chitin deacetylase (PgdA/CDA1 family)